MGQRRTGADNRGRCMVMMGMLVVARVVLLIVAAWRPLKAAVYGLVWYVRFFGNMSEIVTIFEVIVRFFVITARRFVNLHETVT